VAPVGELPSLLVRTGFPGELPHQVAGNEVANLLKNGDLGRGWTLFCFYTRRVAVNEELIQPFFLYGCGMALYLEL
jgi:hypothetical protein